MSQQFSILISSLRPRQWIKNIIVFAAFMFSLADEAFTPASKISTIIELIYAALIFCMISSAVYLTNDIIDRKQDQQHPEKKNRAIASGRLSARNAVILIIILTACSVTLAMFLNKNFAAIISAYFLIFLVYSLLLKKILILDVLTISIGFVLRAVGGAIVADLGISIWLIICTIFLALFLGFSKRRAELAHFGESVGNQRSMFSSYNLDLLNILLAICSTLAILCYTMYSLSDRSFQHVGADSLLTLPFVIFGIFRYLFLVMSGSDESDPVSALFSDIPLLLTVITWIILWLYLLTNRPEILSGVIVL